MAHHPVRHQHRRRPPGRPGITPPATRPRRRPHPRAQRHRPDQPTAAGLRQEPDLARISLPSLRTAHLDPTTGLARSTRPRMGTQTPTTAPTDRRRPTHHHRPTAHPAPVEAMAVGRPHHRRPPPPHRTHLTPDSQPPQPRGPEDRRDSAGNQPRRRTKGQNQPQRPASPTHTRKIEARCSGRRPPCRPPGDTCCGSGRATDRGYWCRSRLRRFASAAPILCLCGPCARWAE